jgi:membrane protein YdbS with pleckstrin-like domain
MANPARKFSIKTSPLLMLETIIVLEIMVALVSVFISVWVDFEKLYFQLSFNQFLSFSIFSTIALLLIQLVTIFIAFIFWYSEKYSLDKNSIIYHRWPFKPKTVISQKEIESVSVTQNFFARLFGIGTLIIQTKNSPRPIRLRQIPNPQLAQRLINSIRNPKSTPNGQLQKLIAGGENRQLEFKSSFFWDYQTNQPNRELHKPVVKCLASFLNSSGGTLLIGVSDKREILGIEPDLNVVKTKSTDGYENLIVTTFNSFVGIELSRYLEITFPRISGKVICVIKVQPSPHPAFVKFSDSEEFFIRAGNSSRPLSIREATEYIQNRFASKPSAS